MNDTYSGVMGMVGGAGVSDTRQPQPNVLADLQRLAGNVETALKLTLNMEDRLNRVLLPTAPTAQTAEARPVQTRATSSLADEVSTLTSKVGAVNERLQDILNRLDV